MKKFLLTLLLLVGVGGIVYADTKEFTTFSNTTLSESPITITIAKGSTGTDPNVSYSTYFRFYGLNTMKIEVKDGYLEKVTFATESSNGTFLTNSSVTNGTFDSTNKTWTASDKTTSTFTLTNGNAASGHTRINKITVEYQLNGAATKTKVELAWNPAEATLNLGETFTAPILSAKVNGEESEDALSAVVYSSDNENLLKVAKDGTFTLSEGSVGSATVSASIPTTNETFFANPATYTLTIKDPNAINVTLKKSSFTFDGTTYQEASISDEYATYTVFTYPNSSNEFQWNVGSYAKSGLVVAAKLGYIPTSITIAAPTKTINVFGSNSGLTLTNLANATNIGTITSESATYTFNSDYNFIALRSSATSATYCGAITITFKKVDTSKIPVRLAISPESGDFVVGGNVAITAYNNADEAIADADIKYSIGEGAAAAYTAPFALGAEYVNQTVAVKATCGSLTATASYNVYDPNAAKLDAAVVFNAAKIGKGEEKAFKPESESDEFVYAFASDNEAVAVVTEEGAIKGVKAGKATITASWEETTRFASGSTTFELTVTDVAALSWSTAAVEYSLGEAFTAPVLTVDPIEAAEYVVYTSSNKGVADFNEENVLEIKAAGTTTIKAALAQNDIFTGNTASYTLTVIDPNAMEMSIDFTKNTGDWMHTGTTSNRPTDALETTSPNGISVYMSAGAFFNSSYCMLYQKSGYLEIKPGMQVKSIVIESTGSSTNATIDISADGTSIKSGLKFDTNSKTVDIPAENQLAKTFKFEANASQATNIQIKNITFYGSKLDLSGVVEKIEFTPEGGSYELGQTVEIAAINPEGNPAVGAAIEYSWDNETWETYSEPFELMTGTLYAKSGDITAQASYIISDPNAKAEKPVVKINGVEVEDDAFGAYIYGQEIEFYSANAETLKIVIEDDEETTLEDLDNPYTLTQKTKEAIYTVYGVKNGEESDEIMIMVSMLAPSAFTATLNGEELAANDENKVSTNDVIELTAVGARSFYYWDEDANQYPIEGNTFSFTEGGEYDITFFAENPAGEAIAGSYKFVVTEVRFDDVTFDFTKVGEDGKFYGLTTISDGYDSTPAIFSNGVTIGFTGNYRVFVSTASSTKGQTDLRIYSGATMTFKVPVNAHITKIDIKGKTIASLTTIDSDNFTISTTDGYCVTPKSNNIKSITIKSGATQNINTILVEYTVDDVNHTPQMPANAPSTGGKHKFTTDHGCHIHIYTVNLTDWQFHESFILGRYAPANAERNDLWPGWKNNNSETPEQAIARVIMRANSTEGVADDQYAYTPNYTNTMTHEHEETVTSGQEGINTFVFVKSVNPSTDNESPTQMMMFDASGTQTSLEELQTRIEAAEATAEYYNLQGVRVANPGTGLYIRRQGTRTEKVVIR